MISAESQPNLLVKRLDVDMPSELQGYFRSRLYIAPYSSNPLIAAAGPLFTLLERLYISPSLPEIANIRSNIEHELHAFLSRLQAADYSKDTAAIAHFLMSAAIDEIIGKNYLRVYGETIDFKAFTPPGAEQFSPDKAFFEIIHFIKERPNQYLDVIELGYYCLITGFEGEYNQRCDGKNYLDELIETLYTIIQNNRVNKPCKPSTEAELPGKPLQNRKPVYWAAIAALGLVLSGLWLSQYLLERKTNQILAQSMHLSRVIS